MPGWLKEVSEESLLEAAASTTSDDLLDNELPDWLREVEEESIEPAAAAVSARPEEAAQPDVAAEAEDLPDWLREVGESPVGETKFLHEFESAPETYDLFDTTETGIDEDNLPDWLSDTDEVEDEILPEVLAEMAVPAEAELPDWLKEVQTEEAAREAAAPPVAAPEPAAVLDRAAEPAEAEVEEETLPDWLREVQDEVDLEEEEFDLTAVAEPVSAAAEVEEEEPEEELPEWLQEIDTGEEEAFEPSEPSPEEPYLEVAEEETVLEAELPDWLHPSLAAAGQTDRWEEPAIAAPPAAEIEAGEEEELPEWLQGMAEELETDGEAITAAAPTRSMAIEAVALAEPSEADSEPIMPAEPVAVETPVQAAAVPAAAMPDWLKKLREGEEDKEALPEPVAATRATEPEAAAVAVSSTPAEVNEQLELARTACAEGDVEQAIQLYDNLVTSGAQLDRVIDDIQQTVKSYPSNFMLYQIMGDAMMKEGRLHSALDAYRQALAKLQL